MPLVSATASRDVHLCFVDDGQAGHSANGYDVLTFEQFLALEGPKSICIAIADAKIREMLQQKCIASGVQPFSVTAPNAVIGDAVIVGDNAILCSFTHITSNVTIGVGCHLNIYSYVAHDCVIGDYVTFAPSVKCNGNVHIGDYAYIGAGAILRQGTPEKPLLIGKGAVVGMGAVVTRDVPDGVTVIGNPARVMERRG